MYASPVFFQVFNRFPNDTQLYIVRRGEKILMELLFSEEDGKLKVINEQIFMERVEIERFAQYIFENYPSVQTITFPAITPGHDIISPPHTAAFCTQDIVAPLPSSAREYSASLGKSTRAALKRYTNKLKRDFPSFQFEVVRPDRTNGTDIVAADIQTLLIMGKSRIEKRNQSFAINENEASCITRLCEKCGFLGLIKINNEIVAGTINYRFGDNFFLHVVSHDSRFDQYGIGTICCYLSICECIAMGGKEYHFLWGRYEYKYRLLGTQRDFVALTIYRSSLRKMIHSRLSMKPALANINYFLKDWAIHTLRRNGTGIASLIFYRLLSTAKNIKRSAGFRASRATAPGQAPPMEKRPLQ
jgi:hypothetical protein